MECQVCNQEKKTGKTYKFFAAIEGKTTSQKTGFKQWAYTTPYQLVGEKAGFVCRACFLKSLLFSDVGLILIGIPFLTLIGLLGGGTFLEKLGIGLALAAFALLADFTLHSANFGANYFFAKHGDRALIRRWRKEPEFILHSLTTGGVFIDRARAKRIGFIKDELQAAPTATPGEEIVTVEAMKQKLVQDDAGCAFCNKHRPADGEPHIIVVSRREGATQIEKAVLVPRCTTCEAIHRREAPLNNIVLPVSILAFSSLCILIGILGAEALRFWSWVIGTMVTLVGIFVVAAIITLLGRKWTGAAGTISLGSVQFPEVQELVNQGWVINTNKSGKFTKQPAKK